MLSGCGMQEAPYDLTEEEQQLIVSYSSHVVSKFNKYQKDGLTYVPDSGEEESAEDTEVQDIPETEQWEEDTETKDIEQIATEIVEGSETTEPGTEAGLNDVFADLGLNFTYIGNEVTASYLEDDTYAVNAGIGKNLLVLKFKVENLTEEAIVIDNMASGDIYSAKYIMESGKSYNAKSVMTLLINDFTTYEGTVAPQASLEVVIVFEIPAETTEVDVIELKIKRDGENFQINL